MWFLAVLGACDSHRDFDDDGFVEPADCDDNDPSAHPGAEEVAYDGVDQDCRDGDLVDQDFDGFVAVEADGADCNDLDPDVYPGANEVAYDGIDGDCDQWDDDDFDHDGYAAMGHGGDDCDDEDPRVTPIDSDGDGYSPCTGDCDEANPQRNGEATPVCGNGVDDDCDEVSDCTQVGILGVDGLPRLHGGLDVAEFGAVTVVPGDLDGDGAQDLVATAVDTITLESVAFVLPIQPFPDGGDPSLAWARIRTATHSGAGPAGDVDGDGIADLWVSEPAIVASSHLMVFAPVEGGDLDAADARLDLLGESGDNVGEAVARIEDSLAVGAPGRSAVQLVPADLSGRVAFGEDGVLTGDAMLVVGAALHADDFDGDGIADLLVGAPGTGLGFDSRMYVVPEPPRSGTHAIEDVASGWLDTESWAPSSMVLKSGDLDADGRRDPVIGMPFAQTAVGAVGVALDRIHDGDEAEDLPLQRLGLGDDTFGYSVEAWDFDGDGFDDLIGGAPALLGASGGVNKPGAVHLWYGPFSPSVDHTFTADLFVQGAYNGYRAHTGEALALVDGDLDGGVDLLIASPLFESGVIDLLGGGFTGLYGI